ncbi:fungal specific transcription factor [Trichoderma arundinaceum]|uniref:Fungal specific transcription factor n=1 Tax=Trichoderma arundinaceum TaxID=490622 RepID=A0A395NZQ0_TRIAR|nr:fungal specific transcription factor [Trichoderma arundinaceum]
MPPRSQNSCVACTRRKVKCDKLRPCSSCAKSQVACIYRAPVPSQRHRKRLTQGDLLSKIQELETLLHSHKIPFNALENSWINSPWEEKLVTATQIPDQTRRESSAATVIVAETHPGTHITEDSSQDTTCVFYEQGRAAQLWSGLPEVLKIPPIARLQSDEDTESQPPDTNAVAFAPSLLIPTHLSTAPGQLELHPDPKHVFKLWQTFADNVNPLTKIIHAPTLQKKILETAWAVESVAKPLEATMFAVYALAVASMKPTNCLHIFGESRLVLASRFRLGALRALSAIDLLSTRDLEVLQALTLALMIDLQSEFSITAVALAMRIAHKMGLHRAGKDPHTLFFEQEMQIRLWWYIRGLNSRVRRGMGLLSTIDDLGDTRLPMNVNDADLHPLMEKPPAVQHTAATEMVYCLMKYDLWNYVRKPSNFSGGLNPREKAAQLITSTSAESMTKKRKVLAEVDRMLHEKYLAHLDLSIPLHQLSAALAGLTIHNQRFLMFHPRHQPEGGRYMSLADQDLVFESSVKLLELNQDVRNTGFSTNLVDHMMCKTPVDALVYMVSELRQRTNGHLVETAWALLDEIYNRQSAMLLADDNFYSALSDLTLQAWEARWRALGLRPEAVPKFMDILQAAKETQEVSNEPAVASISSLQTMAMTDLAHEDLDWTYWDDLLQL